MAKLSYLNGVTSVILRVKLLDSASTTGAGKTALDHTAAGLIISTIADNEASATVYTAAGSTIEAVTTLGTFSAPTATKCRFKKVDDTNHPGLYEIQIADARWAVSNAKSIIVTVQATGVVPVDAEIQLSVVPADVRQWLGTACATPATNGYPVTTHKVGTGTGELNTSSGAVIVQSGTGTGQLDFTSGRVKADTVYFGGSAGSFTTGVPAVNTTLIAGSLVSTSTAQIGVNVVNFGGSAGTFASGRPEVNATAISGDSVAADRLETMLDGTGGNTLSLGSIAVTGAFSVAGGFALSNTGSGKVFSMIGAGSGDVVYIESNSGAPVKLITGGGAAAGISFSIDSGVDVVFSGAVTATNASNDISGIDVKKLSGDAQSLTDLKDFADSGYDPSTNKVEGVKLADSLTAVATGGISAASFAAGAIDAAAIAANAIGASELAADAATEIADAILSRNVSNVEGSAGEHTLCTVVLAMLENSISGTTLTIKRTDGSTTHYTKTLSVDAAADPITGIQ